MLEVIKKYLSSGLSVIPVKADKRPQGPWQAYQAKIAGEEYQGWGLPIGIVCGPVSGGLTCIDFDDNGSAFAGWCDRVKSIMADVFDFLTIQRTPSGGWHVVFRSELKIENRKLAQRKTDDGKTIVLIETRGEGGYFLAAPSDGYVLKHGDFCEVKTIAKETAETLIHICESFNETVDEKEASKQANIPLVRNGVTPFDAYDAKNTPVDLLLSHGWSIVGNGGREKVMLCRPGKKNSLSATWNYIPNRFYVFSTSTDFEAQHVYKASAVYAMLQHRGDFVQAAKQLYADGYGDRMLPAPKVNFDTTPKTTTVKISSYRQNIYDFYKGSRERGAKIGLPEFDKLIRFAKGYLNVISGISTHGKSEFLDFITMLLAKTHDWNFVIFSPENYPLEIHFNKLAEKYHCMNMWDAKPEVIEEAIDFIDDHFDFINATEDDLTLESILSSCLDVKVKGKLDCLIIDPWNEIEQAIRPVGMNESDFIGDCLRKLRKFARKNDLCLFIVVHPTKMYKDRDKEKYPVPTLYDISGSANWYNKADNGVIVYRNFEPDNETTDVYVKKVKFRNYGEIGMARFIYNKLNGTYQEIDKAECAHRDFYND
jgi:hypothetical protein